MKGISLPVNFTVVLVVAIIALAVVIGFLVLFWPKPDWNELYGRACTIVAVYKFCNIDEADLYTITVEDPKTHSQVTLHEICYNLGKFEPGTTTVDLELCKKGCAGCL